MTFEKFKEALFEEALKQGAQAAEAYYVNNEDFTVNILEGEQESYEVNRSGGVNLRVRVDGKDGYAFTETLEDAKDLVAHAIDNAQSIENTDDHPMQGKSEYEQVTQPELPKLDEREKIELAKSIELSAKAVDKRVQRMQFCGVSSTRTQKCICNTLGLDAQGGMDFLMAMAMPIVAEDGDVRNGFSFRSGARALDVEGMAKDAVKESTDQLHGSPVPPGEYSVIIRSDAMSDLLQAFSSMFSAEAAQKGLSLFKDKLGEKVAAANITIVDDPLHPMMPRAFDDEGVPSRKTVVVDNGVLKSFLHNLKTAKKAGLESTGNAGRNGASGSIGVKPTNFYIQPGTAGLDELIAKLNNGLLITGMSGMHSGLNAVSGEFSLIANGRLIENGKDVRAVDQITVGGSFISLMESVLEVGGDMFYGMPASTCVSSPSLLIGRLMVSGQ